MTLFDFLIETAVNIGYSCKMLTDDMTEIFIVNGHTVQSVRADLRYGIASSSNIHPFIQQSSGLLGLF